GLRTPMHCAAVYVETSGTSEDMTWKLEVYSFGPETAPSGGDVGGSTGAISSFGWGKLVAGHASGSTTDPHGGSIVSGFENWGWSGDAGDLPPSILGNDVLAAVTAVQNFDESTLDYSKTGVCFSVCP